ncbi:hypothetical protein MMC25_000085 [Agyrium rufum]|nr:hypothetical protein [Agyrium rufum]
MAPVRRYLRITKHSVLEVRIYLDNPADAQRWLLNPRDPMLPQVMEAVRPLVLPKLREENERNRGKPGKRKGVKDTVVQDDFDVSIFLTELSTRHSILTKQKFFREKAKKLQSNSDKLTGTQKDPVNVEDGAMPQILREAEDEDMSIDLKKLPMTSETWEADHNPHIISDESDTGDIGETGQEGDSIGRFPEEADDKKKKLAMNTTYDGFSIYGRILCLVVKRKGNSKGKQAANGTGKAMMEGWITSTQMQGMILDDD